MDSQTLLRAPIADLKPRERILKTALRLFNTLGPNRTGTDLIIEESGVAKMTFFRQFKSKGLLIAEILKLRDEDWFALLRRHSVNSRGTALEKVLGLFDGLKEWFEQPDFQGCPFIRGIYDFVPDTDEQEILEVIERHFQALESLITELVKPLQIKDQKKVVLQIMSAMAGSIVVAQVTRSSGVATINREQLRQTLGAAQKKH